MASLANALPGAVADDFLMAASAACVSVGLLRAIGRHAADRSVVTGTHLRSGVDASGQLGSVRRVLGNAAARTAEYADRFDRREK